VRTNPKHNKILQGNKTFRQSLTKNRFKKALSAELEDDISLLDLLSKNMSPNDIVDHIWNVKHVKIYSNKIIKQLLLYKARIHEVNRRFDCIAGKKLKVSVIDETFKGRKITVLVFMDMITGYVFLIQWIKNRRMETIKRALKPFQEIMDRVDLVLTDGAPYFPEVVHAIFPNARHQTCLVHVMRGLFKKLQPIQKNYRSYKTKVKELRKKIFEMQSNIRERAYNLKCIKQRIRYHEYKRAELRIQLGIKPYQKDILKKHPILRESNQKINYISGEVRSMNKTLKGNKKKRRKLAAELQQLIQVKNMEWGKYMKYWGFLHRFYNLFEISGVNYIAHRQKLLFHLRKHRDDPFLNGIIKVIRKTKSLDTVNTEGCSVFLSRRFINTNAIDSINSRIRPILDKLRKIQNGEYIQTIFDLVKLRLNASHPRSGCRRDSSPIERYGYDLRGRTYIELILEGLPSGPQYGINSSAIDLAKANSGMVDECKINAI